MNKLKQFNERCLKIKWCQYKNVPAAGVIIKTINMFVDVYLIAIAHKIRAVTLSI